MPMTKLNKQVLVFAVLLSGCVHEAPPRPESVVPPAQFSVVGEPAKEQWWKSFNEPALDELILRAYKANPDLTVAQARWRSARAGVAAANADLLPRLDAQVSFESSRNSAESGRNFPGMPRRFDILTVGGQASWELDIWGQNKDQAQAAMAEAMAASYSADDAKISLSAEVARHWFSIQAARVEAECLAEEFKARYREMELIEKSVNAGILASDPLSAARLAAAQAKLEEAQAIQRLAALENALRVLLGASPSETLPPSPATTEKKTRPEFGAGVPSALLLRRPDLMAAAAKLDAAMSREGAARADFYPRVTLTGQAGWQADPASRVGRGSSGFWSLMPSIDLPLFDADRRNANLELARTEIEIAGANWRKAVLNAFREVEDSLVDLRELALQVDLAERVLVATKDRYQNAQTRFAAGVANEQEVVIAQRDVAMARRTYVRLELERCQASVRLIAATGGGWTQTGTAP
jgi:NodT family efflux transporter outer membrane factor (OMF) lipoprotein